MRAHTNTQFEYNGFYLMANNQTHSASKPTTHMSRAVWADSLEITISSNGRSATTLVVTSIISTWLKFIGIFLRFL